MSEGRDACLPLLSLNLTASELKALKEEDSTLKAVREVAGGRLSTTAGKGFFRQDGLIF